VRSRERARPACWLVLVLLAIGCFGELEPEESLPDAESSVVGPGVVVETVPKASALERAGIQPGDILLSWERLPAPPTNPEAAKGEFRSPFDFHDLRIEQAPRGVVEISGKRDGVEKRWRIELGSWRGAEVQPVWVGAFEERSFRVKEQIEAKKMEEGVRALQHLADELARVGEDRLRLWVLYALGTVWIGDGRELPRSSEGFQWVLTSLKTTTVHKLESAYVHQRFGNFFRLRGDVDQAHHLYKWALEVRRQLVPQSQKVSDSLNDLGLVAWERGDLRQAEKCFRQALGIIKSTAPGSLHEVVSQINLGMIEIDRGHFDAASGYLAGALQVQARIAPGGIEEAVGLSNLGRIAWGTGNEERAEEYFTRALHIHERLSGESVEVAKDLNNLGVLAKERGQLSRAQEFYTRALQICERRAPESLTVAALSMNLGVVALERGKPGQAHRLLSRALELRQQLAPESLAMASSLSNLAFWAKEQGDSRLAQELYTRAARIKEDLAPGSLETARSLFQLARLSWAEGHLDRAAAFYLDAISHAEAQMRNIGGSYELRAGFRAQQRLLYQDASNLLLDKGQQSEAFHIHERFRARTFLTMLAERDIASKADIPEELDQERRRFAVRHDRLLKSLAKLSATEDREEVASIREELEAMSRERGDIEERIRRASPRLAALQYPQPLTVEEAQKALDPGTLLLSFMVGEESTSIFALSPESGLEVETSPIGEATLRQRIGTLRELLPVAIPDTALGKERAQELRLLSQDLYRLLLEPVEERIEKSQRLLILPDGPLHALPFAVLIRGDSNETGAGKEQYLAEWKPVHVGLSVTAYAELKKARSPKREATGGSAQVAVFGDPTYPEAFTLPISEDRLAAVPDDAVLRSVSQREGLDFQWRPLPFTRREVEGIVGLFPRGHAQAFLGKEALEERVKNLGPGVRILHLAAHAYTDDRIPLSSFIALTIPEDLPEDRDNGLLQAWEILEQVRIDADLVVLSGCLTGMGKELRGEGLIGLTRAFQYAGARSLMSTLWNVNDQATAELMIRFYRHLRDGLPKDEALRAAQIEMIREPIISVNSDGHPQELKNASAPYYWAGVQLYGDWM
jgi:CHAT domain-containing protein/Tfp pilus assembly protein PilF